MDDDIKYNDDDIKDDDVKNNNFDDLSSEDDEPEHKRQRLNNDIRFFEKKCHVCQSNIMNPVLFCCTYYCNNCWLQSLRTYKKCIICRKSYVLYADYLEDDKIMNKDDLIYSILQQIIYNQMNGNT